MRLGLPGDDRDGPWPGHDAAGPAPALPGRAQGHEAARPAGGGSRHRFLRPAAEAGPAVPRQAVAALRPALGHEPLRGAGPGPPRQRDRARPGRRRAPAEPGRGLRPFHRRRRRTDAQRRLQARRATAAGLARRAHRQGARPASIAGADPARRAGAGAVRDRRAAVQPAHHRRRPHLGRPRPAQGAPDRLRPAAGDPDGARPGTLVDAGPADADAVAAMARQHLRPPAAAAGRILRAAPPRRHHLALRRGRRDPEDADHRRDRGAPRRPDGRGRAGHDAGLCLAAGAGRDRRRRAVRPAALGRLPAAARRGRRTAGRRRAGKHALPRDPAGDDAPEAVRPRAGAARAMAEPDRRGPEPRCPHRQAVDGDEHRQHLPLRRGEPAGALPRRRAHPGWATGRHGHDDGGHAVRVPQLQGAVHRPRVGADQLRGGTADAGPACRTPGRHRARAARTRRGAGP